MAECDWAILCDYAFRDETRKTCLVGIFDRVYASSVPTNLRQSAFAFRLLGNPNEKVLFRVQVIRPTQAVLATFEGDVELGATGVAEVQMAIAGLPLPDYGLYNFNVQVDNSLLKSVGFLVDPPQRPQQ